MRKIYLDNIVDFLSATTAVLGLAVVIMSGAMLVSLLPVFPDNKIYEFSTNGRAGTGKECKTSSMTCLDGNGFTIKVDKFKEVK